MQPLSPAALVFAHWTPWFSDSYLNSMKLYHKGFDSALNLQMKSNLVHMLQCCKSKPIIFLLTAEGTRVSEAQNASTKTVETQLI